jgi:hypothetical protein
MDQRSVVAAERGRSVPTLHRIDGLVERGSSDTGRHRVTAPAKKLLQSTASPLNQRSGARLNWLSGAPSRQLFGGSLHQRSTASLEQGTNAADIA